MYYNTSELGYSSVSVSPSPCSDFLYVGFIFQLDSPYDILHQSDLPSFFLVTLSYRI